MSKAKEITVSKELVHINHKIAFTDSLIVAEKFEKHHKVVLRAIDNIAKMDKELLRKYKGSNGKEYRKYDMTRDGFSMLVMGFTGKKAFKWKKEFLKAFNTMEQIIKQREKTDWQLNRKKGIVIRKDLADVIEQFIEYAKKQGSKKAEFYYQNITRETYKALELIKGREKVPSKFRETLDNFETSALAMAEYVAQGALLEGMLKQMYYKDIYTFAKEKVLVFASSIAIAKITKGAIK